MLLCVSSIALGPESISTVAALFESIRFTVKTFPIKNGTAPENGSVKKILLEPEALASIKTTSSVMILTL